MKLCCRLHVCVLACVSEGVRVSESACVSLCNVCRGP